MLGRAKFDRYLNLEERQAFIAAIRRSAELFSVPEELAPRLNPRCRDPADDVFLALAVTAAADSIVSSDEDLLSLHPWHGIQIVKPSEFVESFGKAAGDER